MSEQPVTIALSDGSSIEWTDYTFNPWWGCTRVSPACANCYAEALAKRFGYQWGKTADRRFFEAPHWAAPLKWDRRAERDGVRRKVFCASMADVFEDREDTNAWLGRLWFTVESTRHLDWLLLTKRPENIMRLTPPWWHRDWPAHVWVGTTVEDQQRADERIPHLLAVPAPVRFLSVEPMLGPVTLPSAAFGAGRLNSGRRIDWVICGGESGPGARPMGPEDARQLRDQCAESGVPFFFKQWGDWLPHEYGPPPFWMPADGGPWVDGHELPADLSEGEPTGGWWAPDISEDAIYHRVGKKNAGRRLDGRTHDATPEASR